MWIVNSFLHLLSSTNLHSTMVDCKMRTGFRLTIFFLICQPYFSCLLQEIFLSWGLLTLADDWLEGENRFQADSIGPFQTYLTDLDRLQTKQTFSLWSTLPPTRMCVFPLFFINQSSTNFLITTSQSLHLNIRFLGISNTVHRYFERIRI